MSGDGSEPSAGRIGRDWRDSRPWWPTEPAPPPGTPNVVLIVLDDVGFAQLGCYGSDVATPSIDRLAADGVRLANFHTTALCSPTRACLLTGRNHHRSGMGRVAELAVGFPGYWGRPPRENGYLSEVLRASGYASYAVGKWHLTPDHETHMGASRATWPLARGFDRWYGFHGGETHQFVPALFSDNHSVRPPAEMHDGYHLTVDLVDHAVRFIGDLRAADGTTPFFLYLATGACHSPHHAPTEWISRYRNAFDGGWDAWRERTFARQLSSGLLPPGTRLSPRPPWVPAWEDLDADARAVASRFMECFAAYLSHTDAQIGRLLAFLEDLGEADNTLVLLLSDNGASAEGGADGSINDVRMQNLDAPSKSEMRDRIDDIGGPLTHNNYPWGWTMAGNTPFKRWKREVHEGGVADPCLIWWPRRLTATGVAGSVRHQYAHAIDVVPTVLELVGIEAPATIDSIAQSRGDGTSFAYLLDADGATAEGRHHTQHYEMFGSRAIYHDGWKAVTYHPVGPLYDDGLNPNAPFDEDVWELYHVAEDLSETDDVADRHPDRVAELVELWWEEARRNDVLPLDNRVLWALVHRRPDRRANRSSVRLFPGGAMLPEQVAVNVHNRPHTVTVDLEVAGGRPAEGVLVAHGSALGGWSLHLLRGHPRYVHNLYGKDRHFVGDGPALEPGRHTVEFAFTPDGGPGGRGVLSCDGGQVAAAHIPVFTPSQFNGLGVGVTCGYEWGPPVGEGYTAPFPCTARILRATVTATGPVVRDPLAELEAILAEQ